MEYGQEAIIITHAHPDHLWGLKKGAPCPVYATEEAWQGMKNFDIDDRREIKNIQSIEICGMEIEAFPVIHSKHAPAIGYRITAGKVSIFYVPDVVYIPDRKKALSDVRLYIGDGATIKRPMVRKINDNLVGHVPVSTQLTWCSKEGVSCMVVTHCGSEIVKGDSKEINTRIKKLAQERGVYVNIAYDGMELILR